MVAVSEAAAIGAGDHSGRREPAPVAKAEVGELADAFSKLNPSAEEFVPPSRRRGGAAGGGVLSADAPMYFSDYSAGYLIGGNGVNGNAGDGGANGHRDSGSDGSPVGHRNRRRRNCFTNGRRMNGRARMIESVRRTVYVSEIDQNVTEEKLAEVFSTCGQVVDCRICGDPLSVLRFAFIEFSDEVGARAALSLNGTVLCFSAVVVLPSKTAILPVNPKFLPRTDGEREMVLRTVYCTNIDKKVTELDVKVFFEHFCGEVSRLRLLSDFVHSSCIAFVEFVQAESAILALNCSGMVVGTLPIRVSPSKTPVRPRMPSSAFH